MATHRAAASLATGQPFTVQSRRAPKPGPGELLIAVKSIALNPADIHMRDSGLFVPSYPTVVGFDLAGLVIEVGENVPVANSSAADEKCGGPTFQPGITRVAAYAASVWKSCDPDYGAFQEKCLVPWQQAIPLPDAAGISWNEAATLPVAVQVPLSAWDAFGILRMEERETAASCPSPVGVVPGTSRDKEALLIWGASSSVGTMGVQTARVLRDARGSSIAAVYATAGPANHAYISSLGADRVFDYKDPHVVDAIILAARADGVVIRHCFLANGNLAPCQGVMRAFATRENQDIQRAPARIASAPIIPTDAAEVEGVETIFVMPYMDDEEKRLAQFRYWMGSWATDNLLNGHIRPSPEPRVVGRGLDAINRGLDELAKGVSCAKLVVEVAE
ncbi:GroES-like protein [Aspergillus pseudoustus]|uniref:GroES-like protein n=1 Tax=Aspergillus pseudoustus TaxID=1810923 RepID=A0ABR4J5Z1_9EURO